MPYFYITLIKDYETVDILYNNIKACVEKAQNGEAFNIIHVNFDQFDMESCQKLEDKLFSSMKKLDCIKELIDYNVKHLYPTDRFQISYIMCNFMFLLTNLIHSNSFYQYVNVCCAYWKKHTDKYIALKKSLIEDPKKMW